MFKRTISQYLMASVVGSLAFCDKCGNLLDPIGPADDSVRCACCLLDIPVKGLAMVEVVTESRPSAFPSALRQKRSVVKQRAVEEAPTIQEKCPQCGREEMTFHTLQLRSADEGATVFYSCVCGYRSRMNN
jgi:DNA-directed RNA polymerase I subunit RPA12